MEDEARQAQRRTRVVLVVLAVVVALTTGLVVALVRTAAREHGEAPGPGGQGRGAPLTRPAASHDEDVTWEDVAGAQLPVSAEAGPRVRRGGRAWGFTRSPFGAVLGALHIGVRSSSNVGPAVYRPTIADQVVGDRSSLRIQSDTQYEADRRKYGIVDGEPIPQASKSRYVGWRVDGFEDDEPVTVHLLASGETPSGTTFVDLVTTVRWEDGDWRLVAPTDGSWQQSVHVVSGPSGFRSFDEATH